jgi:hypothetical protein
MKTEAKNIGRWKDLALETVCVECKNKSGTSNSSVKTGHLRMSQEICEPHKLGSTNIKELQKTALRGTADLLREAVV